MAEIQIKKGTTIFQKDTPLSSISIILDGRVEIQIAEKTILLETGDALGLIDLSSMVHSYDQVALSDLVVDSYPLKQTDDLLKLIQSDPDFASQITMSMLHLCRHILDILDDQIGECDKLFAGLMQIYTDYMHFCGEYHITPKQLPGINQIPPLSLATRPADYSNHYYEELSELCFDINLRHMFTKSNFIFGMIMNGCEDIHTFLEFFQETIDYQSQLSTYIMQEDHLDFVDLYSDLRAKINKPNIDFSSLHNAITGIFQMAVSIPFIDADLCDARLEEYDHLQRELAQELENDPAMIEAENQRLLANVKDSFEQILTYSQLYAEQVKQARELMETYRDLPDKTLDDDSTKELRLALTRLFELLYSKVFFESMKEDDFTRLPVPVQLFLRYGFLDETICATQNTIQLCKANEKTDDSTKTHIYYAYDWLKLIYQGEKEPSRNMLDQTFPAYVESLANAGDISADEKSFMLNDAVEKVQFELQNLFANGLKMTFGRLATYCPVLAEHDMLKSPKNSLLSKEQVKEALCSITDIDFSAFYRETLYYDKAHGIAQEFVQKEYLPDIILLPNVGTRGVLWQEIQGNDRSTPACMLLPIQCLSDIKLVILRLTGEFRWEMCKRIQGPRWNDVSSPSLTGEYFDYLQFYKKNSDLSSEAKEKCKMQLQRTKNRYRENFLLDYASWIMYETNGLPKLNKVSRKILMRYCPPCKEKREILVANPLFSPLITQFENRRQKEENRVDRLLYRLKKNYGSAVPEAILSQASFIKK